MADRTVSVRLDANVGAYERGMLRAAAATKLLRDNINDSNDRTAWFAGTLLALAPAAAPIGGVIVPAVAALATQAGLAAAAGGVMALAFVGVGDALTALNNYQLDPTEAHLKKMNQEMKKIGPEGKEFVEFLDSLGPQLNELRTAAREGMFPGLEEGITAFMDRLPDLREVVTNISEVMGELGAEAGEGLASGEFNEFFEYLKTDAAPILLDVGEAFGNMIDGILSIGVAFGPLTEDFSGGMLEMSRSFEQWAENLQDSQSFQDFVDYVRRETPHVLALIGQLGSTFVALAEAAAPVGALMIPALTGLLRVVEALANTPVGSVLIFVTAAASLYGRLVAIKNLAGAGIIGSALTGQFTAAGKSADGLSKNMARLHTSAGVAGLGLFALSGAVKDSHSHIGDLTEVLGAAAVGFSVGGPWGAAIGGAVGLLTAFGDSNTAQVEKVRALTDELRTQEGQITRTSIAQKLADEGVLEAGGKVGLDPKTLVDAAFGKAEARERVAAAGRRPGDGQLPGFGGSIDDANFLSEEGRAYDKVTKAIAEYNVAIDTATRRRELERQGIGQTQLALDKLKTALVGIPPAVVTELRTLNYEPTKAQITDIANRYNITPKQVTTLVEALNTAPTKEAMDALIELLDEYDGTKAEATVDVDTSDAEASIKRVLSLLDDVGAADSNNTLQDMLNRAAGGAVYGPGTATSDSIPALLSNGEHVLTAREVEMAGGQAAVYRLRQEIRSGRLQFAGGGEVRAWHPPSAPGYAAGGAVAQSVNMDFTIRNLSMGSSGLLAVVEAVATDAAGRELHRQVFESTFGAS